MSSPLIFLHGWGLYGGIWAETAAALAPREVRTPDLPGYGTVPSCTPYDAAHLAEAVAADLPADAVLVGWSMGGMAALALAAHHPIKALVLIGSSPAFVARPGWPHGMAPEVLAGFADSLAGDYRATLLRFLSLQARGGDAAREVIARLRQSVFEHGEPQPDTLAAGLELLRSVDLRTEAGKVACPTLVVHGGRDTLCPPTAGEWLAEHIPDARLALQPQAAHAPFLSHSAWFADQINTFLDEIRA